MLPNIIFYKREHFLEIPQNIKPLLDRIESPGIRTFAFCGFRQLVDSMYLFLATSEGRVLFKHRTELEKDLSEQDMLAKARMQRNNEMDYLKQTKELLIKGKPFGAFHGARQRLARDRQEFMLVRF